jgi:hypothetical protein
MKIVCTECKQEMITMGQYYEENYKGKEDEYVCLVCRTKKNK